MKYLKTIELTHFWMFKSWVTSLNKWPNFSWNIYFNLSNCQQNHIQLFWLVLFLCFNFLCQIWISGRTYIINMRLYSCITKKTSQCRCQKIIFTIQKLHLVVNFMYVRCHGFSRHCFIHQISKALDLKMLFYLYMPIFYWLQLDLSPQALSSQMNIQPFSPTGQMIEMCCEYLSLRFIWLYVLIMSRTRFKVNPHSIVA